MGNSSNGFRTLKYTPREQISRAYALRRMDFDDDESDTECASQSVTSSDSVSQVEVKTELGTNTLTGHNETNRKRQLETMFSEKVLFLSFHPNYDTWF